MRLIGSFRIALINGRSGRLAGHLRIVTHECSMIEIERRDADSGSERVAAGDEGCGKDRFVIVRRRRRDV
jgi:hypothetical protein